MKRVLGITMALGLVSALTIMAQDVKPGKEEVIDLGKGVKLEMVLIPAGKFMMGARPIDDPFSNKKPEGRPSEYPQHEVTLTKSFYMGKYELTQEQWYVIMESNPSEEKGKDLPVGNVSWKGCQEFIKKLNATTKGGYRLPTEAEWEYSCRAGTKTPYFFGETITSKDANVADSRERRSVLKVGTYKPNAFGLYDMHGNVSEYCGTKYGQYPKGPVTDPMGSDDLFYVFRGGAFNSRNGKADAKSVTRFDCGNSSNKHSNIGFRLARTP